MLTNSITLLLDSSCFTCKIVSLVVLIKKGTTVDFQQFLPIASFDCYLPLIRRKKDIPNVNRSNNDNTKEQP